MVVYKVTVYSSKDGYLQYWYPTETLALKGLVSCQLHHGSTDGSIVEINLPKSKLEFVEWLNRNCHRDC